MVLSRTPPQRASRVGRLLVLRGRAPGCLVARSPMNRSTKTRSIGVPRSVAPVHLSHLLVRGATQRAEVEWSAAPPSSSYAACTGRSRRRIGSGTNRWNATKAAMIVPAEGPLVVGLVPLPALRPRARSRSAPRSPPGVALVRPSCSSLVFGCDPDSFPCAERAALGPEGRVARARRGGGPPGMRGAGRDVRPAPVREPLHYERHGRRAHRRVLSPLRSRGVDLVLLPGFPLSHPDHAAGSCGRWRPTSSVLIPGSSSGPDRALRRTAVHTGGTRPHVHACSGELAGSRCSSVFLSAPVIASRAGARDPFIRLAAPLLCLALVRSLRRGRTATPGSELWRMGRPGHRTNLHAA